jgi:hypothetical protein
MFCDFIMLAGHSLHLHGQSHVNEDLNGSSDFVAVKIVSHNQL